MDEHFDRLSWGDWVKLKLSRVGIVPKVVLCMGILILAYLMAVFIKEGARGDDLGIDVLTLTSQN
jgi:hypothetical protein